MRRAATFAAAWVVAALVALVVAWQGVGIVGERVTADRPAALTAAEISERAATATSAPGDTTSTTTATAPTETSTPPGTGAPAATTTTTPAGTVAPGGTPAPTTTAPSPSPVPPPAAEETRTYNLVGGSAALRFTAQGVTVLWANPNPGFEVEVEPENVNGVKVEFESEDHRSRVDGWWDGGPQDRVREEPQG